MLIESVLHAADLLTVLMSNAAMPRSWNWWPYKKMS